MRRSASMRRRGVAVSSTLVLVLVAALGACGGAGKGGNGAASGAPTGEPEKKPQVVIEDATETWYEEESGPARPGDKGTNAREYVLDVSREEGVAGQPTAPVKKRVLRVTIRFPVPKVQPPGAREVHAINRLVWEVRKEMAKCFYKGPGKEPGNQMAMIGRLAVSKKGEITKAEVERSDQPLRAAGGFEECVIENINGLVFSPAGDDTVVRFKLKFQTTDVTGSASVTVPPASKN